MEYNEDLDRTLFEALHIGLVLTRMDGSIVEVNQAFSKIIGYKNEDVYKLSYWGITPVDYSELEQKQLHELQDSRQCGPYEKEYLHADGHRIPVRSQRRIIKYKDEELILSCVEDISETKLAQRNIKRFKATIDETLDCVFMFAADSLQFFYVNDGVVKQIGYEKYELMEMTPIDINPYINETQFRDIIKPLVNGSQRITTVETVHQHKNGSLIPVEIFMQYIHLRNEKPHFIAIVRDITERKRAEQILIQAHEDLEEQFRKRIKKYILAKEEAEHSNNAKSQFLSSMSHELRTPLNAVLGFTQLIEMTTNEEDTKDRTQEIINAGNHILALINDILDLTKIESGNVEVLIDKVNFKNILNQVLSLIKPLADQETMQIHNKVSCCTDIEIKVDEIHFKQVLLNILSNALKYNSANGKVIVDCSTDDNMLQLSIADTGKGLTPEQLSSIFQPFNRVGAENSNIEGTGLGLAITKNLLEKMGGTITVESVIGRGSTFYIQVPLS